ncbi:MAG TPA: UDP-N-acetylmuramate dehydrogenase [Candidatus Limnocylindrales bacterium]|nr:UDP-N-acetylmuramate dehydrogenase [Candidatus Limnocylindrales bacterium]
MTARSATGEDTAAVPAFDALALGGEIQRRIGVKTSRDEPLARFTTMRVGGPADLFVTAHNRMELRALVRFARSRQLPHVVLGRGSDVVISDRGIRGLVIQNRAEGSRIDGDGYTAESGVPMARAATETQKGGLSGLEFGLAIPGSVGGAVWANAGAHESDVAAILESADVLIADGTEAPLSAAQLDLAYRDSRLKHASLVPEIVLAATFRLQSASADEIKERLDDIRRWRQAHQPLGLPSAGSFFRNPEGDSAGRLIDAAGLKGTRIGGAVVSEKHANFIVNDAKGRAADVRRLADRVRDEIERRDGIRLEFEAVFLGDWDGWPWPDDAGQAA